MSQPFLFVLMALFAYRVYRLVGLDTITQPLRDRWEPDGKLGDFVTCPWCAGFWISVATVSIVAQVVVVQLPVLQAGAVSCVVGLVGGNLEHG